MTRWRSRLPFPVQVVARVEVIDEISGGKLATEYRYHQGYWDGEEREFRGFGLVEQFDTETFDRFTPMDCAVHRGSTASIPALFSADPDPHLVPSGTGAGQLGTWSESDYGVPPWPEIRRCSDANSVELDGIAKAAALNAEPSHFATPCERFEARSCAPTVRARRLAEP